jgi:hypothetical protein
MPDIQAFINAKQVLALKDTVIHAADSTLYKVQLLAMHSPINIESYFSLLLSRMPGLEIVETQEEDGFYHYSTGVLRNITKAREFEKIIRNSGWVDCFITTYTSGKRR